MAIEYFVPANFLSECFISAHFSGSSAHIESHLGQAVSSGKSLELRDLRVVAGVGFEPTIRQPPGSRRIMSLGA